MGESNDELIKYITNIDSLFFTKISQIYYDQARNIIKKDLQDLVEVNSVSYIYDSLSFNVIYYKMCN